MVSSFLLLFRSRHRGSFEVKGEFDMDCVKIAGTFRSRHRGSFDFKSRPMPISRINLPFRFDLVIEVLLVSSHVHIVKNRALDMFRSRHRGSFGFKSDYGLARNSGLRVSISLSRDFIIEISAALFFLGVLIVKIGGLRYGGVDEKIHDSVWVNHLSLA